jgi:predicted alpha/beta hydrolase family esterase
MSVPSSNQERQREVISPAQRHATRRLEDYFGARKSRVVRCSPHDSGAVREERRTACADRDASAGCSGLGMHFLRRMSAIRPTLVFVAGYGNSGPGHWQRLWHESLPGSHWVEQTDWEHPEATAWIAGIERTVAEIAGPVFFVTHSLGGLAVAAWSRNSTRPVTGALLVAVPDPDGPGFPRSIRGFGAPDLSPLRFPALMITSGNDPYITPERSVTIAAAWGCAREDVGLQGHINVASNLGDWLAGRRWLEREIARSASAPA